MTETTERISPLRQRMIDDMRTRKLSPKTQMGYIRAVKRLGGVSGALARYRGGRGPATLSVSLGRSWYCAGFADCDPHRPEIFHRGRRRSPRGDCPDEYRACTAQAAGGAESRRSGTPDHPTGHRRMDP